ncbi:hypothetical protein ACS0TY_036822 [Phlomoides rotata]
MEELTYDSDCDSECFSEDSVDDELCYASGEIPKFQFRKEKSKARWIEEFGMAEVLEKKGKLWITTGIVRDGKTYCSIEETLYLAEIGAQETLDVDDTPLALEDLYIKLAEDKNEYGCSWESFEVYRHLKFLGYVVGRHGVPWTMKNVKIKDNGSLDNSCITEMFGGLNLVETRPIFDVYPPNSKFKKSSPGNPSFALCIASGHPPSKQEIEDLEARSGGTPLKFCVVEHGRCRPSELVQLREFIFPVLRHRRFRGQSERDLNPDDPGDLDPADHRISRSASIKRVRVIASRNTRNMTSSVWTMNLLEKIESGGVGDAVRGRGSGDDGCGYIGRNREGGGRR